jgi:uncharacterized protein YbcI
MADAHRHPTERGMMSAAISNAVVRVTHQYTGRGPTKARTHISEDAVTTYMADTLTKGERALVARGQHDAVREMRRQFQRAMQDDLCAAVEKITERQVVAFFSDNHIDPDMALEGFAPAPRADAGEANQPST